MLTSIGYVYKIYVSYLLYLQQPHALLHYYQTTTSTNYKLHHLKHPCRSQFLFHLNYHTAVCRNSSLPQFYFYSLFISYSRPLLFHHLHYQPHPLHLHPLHLHSLHPHHLLQSTRTISQFSKAKLPHLPH